MNNSWHEHGLDESLIKTASEILNEETIEESILIEGVDGEELYFIEGETHYVTEMAKAVPIPKEIIPKKTVKAYKLFRTKNGKLYPLFVKATQETPIGKWIEAEIGNLTKDGKKVKSNIGALAFRPGWHSGDMPVATHIGGKSKFGQPEGKRPSKPNFRPDNQVWAEVLIPADVDWQEEANRRAEKTKKGKIIPRTAQITDQIPAGGFYRYKTNPNMTGNWLISGAMKVVKVLSDKEVAKLNLNTGFEDLPRLEDLKKKMGVQ